MSPPTFLLVSLGVFLHGGFLGESSFVSCQGPDDLDAVEAPARQSFAVPLTNYKNLQYYASLKIGSPWQTFNVAFDTASATWVPSEHCGDDVELCRGNSKYRPDRSSTHIPSSRTGSTSFGNGTVHGFVSYDQQEVAGVAIPRLLFLGIGQYTGNKSTYKQTPVNAILGLAQRPQSYFGALVQQRRLAKPWLGFYFSSDEGVDGEAFFGGANPQHYQPPLVFAPAEDTFWGFQLDGIEMGEYGHYCFGGCIARPATADLYIGGPPIEVQRINDDMGAVRTASGEYKIACNRMLRLHDIKFTIGTHTFVLQPEDYIVVRETPSGRQCFSGFIEAISRGPVTWHLGHVFLRRVYTVLELPTTGFPYGKVGFAYTR